MKRQGLLLALCCALSSPVGAEGVPPPLYPTDFTFKKISPPKPGATRRITIQIEDVPIPVPVAAAPASDPSADSPDGPLPPRRATDRDPTVEAFWDVLGTGMNEAGPGRILRATAHVTGPSGLPGPSLQAVQKVAARYGQSILAQTIGTGVSPALALAVVMTESSGRADAVSGAGAQGLMQLMPATADRFRVSDPLDAKENIRGGVTYLDWLLQEFDGDPLLALAGYNAGENAVKGAGGIPDYSETRAYVPKVMAAWAVTRRLCLTPPELASDGCVFATMASN